MTDQEGTIGLARWLLALDEDDEARRGVTLQSVIERARRAVSAAPPTQAGEAEPNRTTTERGFTCFDSLTDDYGAKVDVIESSAAQVEGDERGPWLWIMVKGGSIKDNNGSAHLSPDQARRVRDALGVWLDEIDPSETGSEDEAMEAARERYQAGSHREGSAFDAGWLAHADHISAEDGTERSVSERRPATYKGSGPAPAGTDQAGADAPLSAELCDAIRTYLREEHESTPGDAMATWTPDSAVYQLAKAVDDFEDGER
jgi:hypothetical protein